MIEGEGFVIVVSSLGRIELYCSFETFQSLIVLLIFEVGQAQVVLCWSVFFDGLTSSAKITNAFPVLFDLPVTVPAVEKSLEISVSTFDVLQAFCEILDG